MKKIGLIVFIVFLIGGFCQAKVIKIGLINPTPKNIEKLLFLNENKIINIDSLEISGIYHVTQRESIERTNVLIANNKFNNVSVLTIKHQIPLDSLFLANACTNEFKSIFQNTDGLVFLGGADISPTLYSEETFLTTNLIPGERNWEISFLFHLLGGYQNPKYIPFLEQNPNYLILGICLGMQEINVASGGTLYQDIPFQIYKKKTYESVINQDIEKQHKNYQSWINNWNGEKPVLHFHHIKITPNTMLDFGLSQNPFVTSVHHQSVKKTGKNFRGIATSLDKKVVEAIANTKFKNVYGVQFHPEFSILYKQKEFRNSKNNIVSFNDNDKQFLKYFWNDFSLRLCDY